MADVQQSVPADHPLHKAWKAYLETDAAKNTVLWAGKSNLGPLWASFVAGWQAAGGEMP